MSSVASSSPSAFTACAKSFVIKADERKSYTAYRPSEIA